MTTNKESEALLTYRIPLKFPYPYSEILELLSREANAKRHSKLIYLADENWLRIRLHIPISPSFTKHSAVGFGWEVVAEEVHRNEASISMQDFLTEYNFCIAHQAIPNFALIENRQVLQITFSRPKSKKELASLKSYFNL